MNPNDQQNPYQQPNSASPQPSSIPPQTPAEQPNPQLPQYQNVQVPQQQPTQPSVSPPQQGGGYEPVSGADAKIGSAKYLLTIFGVMTGYVLVMVLATLLFRPLKLLVYVTYFVLMFFAFKTVTKLKSKGADILTEDEKYRMVFFMAVDPLVAQAFYYYRLRKTMPMTAKIASKVGWKVFFLGLIPGIIGILVLVSLLTVSGVQSIAWNKANEAQFTSTTSLLSKDLSSASSAIQASDVSSLQTSCDAIKTDVETLKQIPAYPDKTVQKQLDTAYASLENGSTDCLNGIKGQDTQLLNNAGSELNTGISALNAPIKTIQANTKN